MPIIFHITSREAWDRAEANGVYYPEMFSLEGFIHCSTPEQVIQVANARFRGRAGLLLLAIDTDRLDADIRYENLEGGEQLFPHIYGGLSVGAVVQVSEFSPGEEGSFTLPKEFQSRER